MELVQAKRFEVPLLISVSGTSGSGKTLSALLLAAGIVDPGGKVAMIDAENKRGTLYADDPLVTAALPQGYLILDIQAPYTPAKYIEALKTCEAAGAAVCLIDSTSHEWEGEGGCCDIAENNKLKGMPNWAMAKREHKRFLQYCLSSKMHIIFCLRARDKVKITADSKVIPIGIQPIAEKNFVYEMLLSLSFDEKTHFASPLKVPKMLVDLLPKDRLITKSDGEKIRAWNKSGGSLNTLERLRTRSRVAAEDGSAAYEEFFKSITATERKSLAGDVHEENKRNAVRADQERVTREAEEQAESTSIPAFGSASDRVAWPDGFDGPECIWNDERYVLDEASGNYRKADTVPVQGSLVA